ncbi:hypothetical protein [Amycolatopsis xylanica]|uniref:hypothetical protein n=1 Tax=Amycolatopsis xylanica TaxID=589385 RepID=UPI0011600740|nr:hypothetical protein [Amycolatopsis xylanica]
MADEGGAQSARRPLTGVVSLEWVAAADPADASASQNFGWFSFKSEPPLEPERLVVLLREVADSIAEEINADLSSLAENPDA